MAEVPGVIVGAPGSRPDLNALLRALHPWVGRPDDKEAQSAASWSSGITTLGTLM